MADEVFIPRRFNGPAQSGHGGYVSGVIAGFVGGTVEVTLRKPPPLETPLAVERGEGGRVRLLDADRAVIGEGRPSSLALDIPPLPSAAAVDRATLASPRRAAQVAYPTCVGCGPARAPNDGLRIFVGPVEGGDLVAAPWTPDPSLVGRDGLVADEYLWTAIDCPSYGAWERCRPNWPALLGRMCGTVLRSVPAGERTTILAWRRGEEGRKLYAASALFAADGGLCAYAAMTWIVTR